MEEPVTSPAANCRMPEGTFEKRKDYKLMNSLEIYCMVCQEQERDEIRSLLEQLVFCSWVGFFFFQGNHTEIVKKNLRHRTFQLPKAYFSEFSDSEIQGKKKS